MDNLINTWFGGYDSWLYMIVLFGSFTIALSVGVKWAFIRSIGLIGVLLGYLAIDHRYQAVASNMPNPITSGFASILSILFVAISMFVLVDPTVVSRMFGLSKSKDNKH